MASNTVIQTNVLALNASRNLGMVGTTKEKSSQKLSSGYKINSAADDAAGLAISEKMRAQIRGLDGASKNTQDAVSLIQTAESGMGTINSMVTRIRELVEDAANDVKEATGESSDWQDRQKIQDEINQLIDGIDQIAGDTEFNKKRLLDGSLNSSTLSYLAPVTTDLGGTPTVYNNDGIATVTAVTAAEVAATKLAALFTSTNAAYAALSSADDTAVPTDSADVDALGLSADTTIMAGGDGKYGALASDLLALATSSITTTALAAYTAAAGTGYTDAMAAATVTDEINATTYTLTIEENTDVTAAIASLASAIASIYADLAAGVGAVTGVTGSASTVKEEASAGYTTYTPSAQVGTTLYFQTGANSSQGMTININEVSSKALGLSNGGLAADGTTETTKKYYVDVLNTTGENFEQLIDKIDSSLSYITAERSKLGAIQNRLEYTDENLQVASENLSTAESRVRDTDMAKEMMNLTKANIIQQAAISMLAQANQAPQSVLSLLQ